MPLKPLPPSRGITHLWGCLKGTLISIFLLLLLLIANIGQMMSLIVLPFSRHIFRRFNRFVANFWWGMCVSVGTRMNGTRVDACGDDVPEKENAIVLMNHQQMSDIPVLFGLARAKGRLGDCKWFAKNAVRYVPAVGWGMAFLDCIFVKRRWADDEASIQGTFSRILRDRVPVWVVTFPEGTRLTLPKLAESQAYAASRGAPILKHSLVPRTKGFVATVRGLRPHLDAVYDLTIGYVEGVPSVWQWIQGQVKRTHLHVRRYPITELPEDEAGLSAWLLARAVEKDARLDAYYRTGVLDTGSMAP